ncbi:Mitochondrial inner membrane translocase complex, subunit Tim21 [Penicillium griseofulvum]|uniref:Mitochondrial import inner membrane translocase subunit Tim21 n=1 Tax=Penicillium patulum TaxID=5078 RepID=A0A135LYP7_PENPA|nr:Mitochondrial inner membrane translocase complex, subunit Tim21 [Penicillium griseofulvum]KXG54041.1 Mitochondrial inner membrane translocase complex, subunit Tim21 [Penicillium griseofulvum]
MSSIQLRVLPRLSSATLVLRPSPRIQTQITRLYATQNNIGNGPNILSPKKKSVTVFSDDGRVKWGDLSRGEKLARTTQQSFNFVIVLVGAVLTGGVCVLFYQEVLSPNSKTWQFETAVGRIKDDPECIKLLGDRREIKAYGEQTSSRWARNKPIASSVEKDRLGREHLRMHFHVEGPLNSGVVVVHMMKPLDKSNFEYQLLALDVKGHSRIVLEKASEKANVTSALKLFGIQWR